MDANKPTSTPLATATSWLAFLIALISVGLLAWYIPSDRSRYVEIFKDFHLDLPSATMLVLRIPVVVFYVTGGALAVGLIAVQWLARSPRDAVVLHLLAILFLLVVYAVYHEVMAQPMRALIEGITR